ncbi:UNVERIFIED_CONTAM: hypothetical protein RMT77_014203 [Armadillidium vulgare]
MRRSDLRSLFSSPIVDMTKKTVDMQNIIDELRDVKNVQQEGKRILEEEMLGTLKLLVSTAKLLLKDFQDILQTIADIKAGLENKTCENEELQKILVEKRKDEEKRVLEFEEEKSEFCHQISLLENHLQEEKDQKIHYKTKAIEMEEKLNRVEEEKRRLQTQVSLQTQVMNEKAKVETLEGKLAKLESKFEGYEDQLKNMQTSLMDKTMEVEKWNQSYIEANICSESCREKMEELQKENSKLVKESEQLNKSLNSTETLLSSFNDSIMVKSGEILQSFYKNLEEKLNGITSLENCLEETETSRLQLKEEKERPATQIFSLQQSLDETKGELKKN